MSHHPLPRSALVALAAALATPTAASPQVSAPAASTPLAASLPPYAPVADLVVRSPFIIDATIRSADRIKAAEAPGLTPGWQRYYVTADVGALIRGADAVPSRVGWLVDVAPDGRGRFPRLKKQRVLAFARGVPGRVDQLILVGPEAQMPWDASLDQRTRAIVREVVATDAPPPVTGVGRAFHVAGTLPGEGETQIFLKTEGDRPLTLAVSRRPNLAPTWSVSASEVIAGDAAPPQHDTLLWYRLACSLPPTLPDSSTASQEPEDAAQAREDYALVVRDLGPCRPGAAAPPIAVSDGGGPA